MNLLKYRLPAVKNKKVNRVSVKFMRDVDFRECCCVASLHFKTSFVSVELDKGSVKAVKKVLRSQVGAKKARRMLGV